MTRSPSGWRRLLVLLSACLTVAASPVDPPESRPEGGQRLIRLEIDAHLRDPAARVWLPPVHMVMPAYEWQDSAGAWNIEVLEGTGSTEGLRADGTVVDVELQTRLEVYQDVPLVRTEADGARVYGFRGDLYLRSEGFELVELDYMLALRVPAVDGEWTPPDPGPLPAADAPEAMLEIGIYGDAVAGRAVGGMGLTEQAAPAWGRTHGDLPFYGPLVVRRIVAGPAPQSSEEMDADRVLGRLLYVRGDYPLAVGADGEVLNHAEYDEQLVVLRQARLLSGGLPLSPDTHDGIDRLGARAEGRQPPEPFLAALDAVIAGVRNDLWMVLNPPNGSALADGPALYAQHCAACHGEQGSGPPAELSALQPAPPAFVPAPAGLTPQRAYNAITFGLQGTAMSSWEDRLGDAERWSLAFAVTGLQTTTAPRPPSSPTLLFEALSVATDAELEAACQGCAAWWRHEGAVAAWNSPWRDLRSRVLAVARGAPDPKLAGAWKPLRRALPKEPARRIDALLKELQQANDPSDRARIARSLTAALAAAEQESTAL